MSNFIRERDGWTCQRCGKTIDPENSDDRKRYHNSHFWGRGAENTRFDPENCDGVCAGCHEYADTHEGRKLWYIPFKIEQLGQQAYDMLEFRKEQYKKRDDFMDVLLVKTLIKHHNE